MHKWVADLVPGLIVIGRYGRGRFPTWILATVAVQLDGMRHVCYWA